MHVTKSSSQPCPSPDEIIAEILALDDKSTESSFCRFGSFCGAIYDTAWLSMVTRKETDQSQLVFPQCFEYLLEAQQDSGIWGMSGAHIDVILNSLAALLALVNRQHSISTTNSSKSENLQRRIEKGKVAVQTVLEKWNVKDSLHVGFEILVPSLLKQLSAWHIVFDFPGYHTLMQLHNTKLQKFKPATVYSNQSTTLLHSLEALVGFIDFDRVGHHCKKDTGIFGSPSATAAYLIHSTIWNSNAEYYLGEVVASTGGTGYVPSAYPTSLFELSWSLSTLITPRVTSKALTIREKEQLARGFEDVLEAQSDIVGFAPGVLEDADDTARSLMALRCLGKSPSTGGMIDMFQTVDHFRTYRQEGSASFSANCNVLLALLGDTEGGLDQENIEKALSFLLDLEEAGPIHDKWNLSPQYSRMLFMQASVLILEKHNANQVGNLASKGLVDRLLGVICRLLNQTLAGQQPDGSWNRSLEITSYSIITVGYALSLPWSASVKNRLNDSLKRGQDYVRGHYNSPEKTDYLWVEKVSYRSMLLHCSYCSAALYFHVVEVPWIASVIDAFTLPQGSLKKAQYLLANLPLFREATIPFLELNLIQAQLVAGRLKTFRNSLFSRSDIPMTGDKYLEFIPMIWVLCNQKNDQSLSYKAMWEMCLLSLFNFQVDEYMESIVAKLPQSSISMLMKLLQHQYNSANMSALNYSSNLENELSHENSESPVDLSNDLAAHEAYMTLSRFVQHVMQHWSVKQSPVAIQREMAVELYSFIQAHNNHNRDNALLAIRNAGNGATDTAVQFQTSREQSYIHWARGTASDDTSCPFSFLFFACLISIPQKHCFDGALAQYFSKSLCRHLATMCRQYNDYGSATRDAAEGNLNSLDFLGLHDMGNGLENGVGGKHTSSNAVEATHNGVLVGNISESEPVRKKRRRQSVTNGEGKNQKISSAKDSLMALAEFERASMELAKERLSSVVPQQYMDRLQVLIDVTDMFGQIYVQKDIASRVIAA
ncbi:unnamed protein product [Periconia digitata]|uniref:Ent-kaurene synthase n=1 Tax=Periconia digitata TaxID=1303443 RepID=A0A9W4XGU1_9PLEO|nr:unnamed protein product [Periconia digitata]